MHLLKARTTSSLPVCPEALRRKYELMTTHWLMVKAKAPATSALKGFTEESFADLRKYLLGEWVWGLEIKDPKRSGAIIARPSWGLVLNYEFELRKAAIQLVNLDGETLHEALKLVIKDAQLRERHFSTPLRWEDGSSSKPTAPDGLETGYEQRFQVDNKGGKAGRGKGKDKGEGKGKSAKEKKVAKRAAQAAKKAAANSGSGGAAPDGSKVCYAYQRGKCTDRNCRFLHVCKTCLKPWSKCKC
jgi:hypothetical protein